MAKARKKNSIVSVISAVTAALRLESIPNPTAEQLQEIHEAKIAAADVIDNSNFVTMGENADDAIELQHQAEAEAEAETHLTAEEADEHIPAPKLPETF